MISHEKFTYDLGKLTLSEKDKAELEAVFDGDGRGHFLASYDSDEISYVTKSGKTIYLYRCN